MSNSILKYLGLEVVTDEETLHIVNGDTTPIGPEEHLQKWLLLFPDNITAQIDAALRQERPFLPPDVTPEMMAVKNNKVSSMTQMEVLYRCVDFAFQAKDFKMAASLAYVVDRATYWSNASKALLQVVDLIKQADPEIAIAPQVQVRKARVLKDEGDLHGAMKVLDEILIKPQDRPGEWKYVDEDQYLTTKAEIIKIKGHILYNMGLLKEAVEPFLESIRLFASLYKKDDKGIASCLGLLTKCLGKLTLEEFGEVQQRFPDYFKKDHPCLESYVQGMEAVKYIQSLHESLYSSRHLLDADTSLLKYAILSPSLSEEYNLLQTILKEMKRSLGAHKTVDVLRSSEQFFEFVRALFMIGLTLTFSPVNQDRKLSELIEQISVELYRHLCNTNKVQRVARLEHSVKSLRLINVSLNLLNLPYLLGAGGDERADVKSQEGILENELNSENSKSSGMEGNVAGEGVKYEDECSEEESKCNSNHLTNLVNKSTTLPKTSPIAGSQTEPSKHKPPAFTPNFKSLTINSHEVEGTEKRELKNNRTSRGWTYSFGYKTCEEENHSEQGCRTFPLTNRGKPLDPKKQWQTYKHKCVGLPVDPNLFAFPIPSSETSHASETSQACDADVSPTDKKSLVNLSVPKIKQTVENRTKTKENIEPTNVGSLVNREVKKKTKENVEPTSVGSLVNREAKTKAKENVEPTSVGSLVNREATTVSTTRFADFDRFSLHPHDLLNQPMRGKRNRRQLDEDVDVSTLAPLVDLVETNMADLVEVELGESISTNDPVEYIEKWRPPQGSHQEYEIQRATLLNYSPTTEVWTAQSTLAFLGDELDLSQDNKGNCRDAFHVQFLHQDEPRGRYVGKRYRDLQHHRPNRYMQDVICQMTAGYYVTKFNEALQNYKRDVQVQFLPAAHLQLLTPSGDIKDYINVEPYLHGDFIKLTNNFAFASTKHHENELATALTHFSFCESKGTLMIVDIQGWCPRESSGVIYLTDPQFHTSGLEKFSPYDHQEMGMKAFWKSVHPRCNDMCRAIGLNRSVS